MSSKNVNSFSTIDTVNTYSNSSLLGIVSGNLTRLTSGNLVLNKVNASNLIYNTGNQIKAGSLVIGNTIVDASYPYTLSLQSNTPETWLEILNHSGANQGVFFGITNNNFEQWNSQAGDILFLTSENPMDGTERLRIKNNGKVGIGTSAPSEKLQVVGNIIANNLVYNTGNQNISGIKTFVNPVNAPNLIYNTGNYNTAFGYAALTGNTIGGYNTAVGNQALQNNTEGGANTAVGEQALRDNKTQNSNTAIGAGAMLLNVSGQQNTAVGDSALQGNISGSYNVAIGQNASRKSTVGVNTSVGQSALYENIDGSNNTAIGKSALQNYTKSDSTAVGHYALASSNPSVLNPNTAVGSFALTSASTAVLNTAIGADALKNHQIGNNNTAIGHASQFNNSTSTYNTSIGSQSLHPDAIALSTLIARAVLPSNLANC